MQPLWIPGVRFAPGWVMKLLITSLGLAVLLPLRPNLRLFRRMLTFLFSAPFLHLHKTATNESMNSMRLHWRSASGVAFSGPAAGSQSFADRLWHSSPLSQGLAPAETLGPCPRRIR